MAEQTAYPQSANGKLFFSQGRFDYECSASVVRSKSRSVVLTAGHCLFDRPAGFSRRIVFIPAYNDGARPFGTWSWAFENVPRQWFRNESPHYDYGALKLRANGSGQVGDVVGEQGLAWSVPREQLYRAIGYPSNFLDGGRMWNCISGLVTVDQKFFSGPPPSGIDCDMASGSSGGGWTFADATGVYLNSVTSYSYDELPGVLFGPYFTREVNSVVSRANRG